MASPVPSWTMAVMSAAAEATARSRAFSRTIFTYSMTLALVGVTSISWTRYPRVSSVYRPLRSISPATVTPSMGLEYTNME